MNIVWMDQNLWYHNLGDYSHPWIPAIDLHQSVIDGAAGVRSDEVCPYVGHMKFCELLVPSDPAKRERLEDYPLEIGNSWGLR